MDLVLLFLQVRAVSAAVQGIFLCVLFALHWRSILDFRMLFPFQCSISYDDKRIHPWNVGVEFCLHCVFIWDGLLYFLEWGYYFFHSYTDIMLATHHALTVCIYCWIVTFRFYNGYTLLPMIAHQWVMFTPNTMSYLVYSSTYFIVFVCAVLVIKTRSYFHYVEMKSMFTFVTLCIVHLLNLTEFGTTTRGLVACNFQHLLEMYIIWGLGSFFAGMLVIPVICDFFLKTTKACCANHACEFSFLYDFTNPRNKTL